MQISSNGYITFSGEQFGYGNTRAIHDDAIPNDMPVKDVTAFHRFGKQVQDYIHFKKTNDRLLM